MKDFTEITLCPEALERSKRLWGQAGGRYRADCRFTWLCVALMSAVLLFLIALLLAIVVHPCGGTLRGPEGSFSSPNHPGPYPPHSLCVWRIEVAAGLAIQLRMEAFSVEGAASCLFDRLELDEEQGDGATELAPARGGTARFCGNVVPPTFNTNSNLLRVTFVSDGSVGAPGFSARYRAVAPDEKTCSPAEFSCGNGECRALESVCDGWHDCPDGTDELNCTGVSYPAFGSVCEPVEVEMCLGLGYNATSFPNIWLAIPDQEGAAEVLRDYQVSCRGWGQLAHPVPRSPTPCHAHPPPSRRR
ncbi:Membrane frizzled-related protein [Aix galericulata]|nr:Membrane frizzled-related protein [Aix galericulata]